MEETFVKHRSRFRRSRVVMAMTACAVAGFPIVAPSGAAPANAAGPVGFGSQQPGIAFESPAHMTRDLDAIVTAHMTWVRADFFWSAMEPVAKGAFVRGSCDQRSPADQRLPTWKGGSSVRCLPPSSTVHRQ